MSRFRIAFLFVWAVAAFAQMTAVNPRALVSEGADQKEAQKVHPSIYRAIGFGNTYMVTTPAGNVIIDTSIAYSAPRHVKLLKAVSQAPVRYIILTHAHGDHTGGVRLWKEAGTQVIAQETHADFMHYQTRLAGFFVRRNAAQFALPIPEPRGEWPGNYGAKLEANQFFGSEYTFELGGLTFRLIHTPGETPDHLTVWIPQLKAAFTGDNYYESFPNLYTLRGTEPRPALVWIKSIDRVRELEPELMLPSHGAPVIGAEEVERRLRRHRDAIQYVHDEVVKGMNAGKDVYTLMREVHLPRDLDIGESYGKLTWSVRGIYEAYAGWFDLDPASLYEDRPDSIHADLVRLAGGPDAAVKLARSRTAEGKPVDAIRFADAALAVDGKHKGALEAKLAALQVLVDRCRNTNERGWLDYAVAEVKDRLGSR